MILTTSMAAPWESIASENHLWGTAHVVRKILGSGGLIILVVALSMGIFTGLNGFVFASSCFLFSMSLSKIMPEVFFKLLPKHETPYIEFIFIVIVSSF